MSENESNRQNELHEEIKRSRAVLAVIHSVQEALSSNLSLPEIYETVGEQLRQVFSVQTIAIYSADLTTNLVNLVYGFEKGNKLPPIEIPLNSLYRHVIDQGTTIIRNGDFPEFAAQFEDYEVPQGEMPKSLLVTQIPQKGQPDRILLFGLVDIDSGNTFSETDVILLETITHSMSTALENVRLFEETRLLLKETEERNAELAVINSVQDGLSAKLDMLEIYNLVGDTISKITGAEVVLIASWDWQARRMKAEYFKGRGKNLGPVSRPFSGLHEIVFPELESGKTIVWNDGIAERYNKFNHVIAAGKIPKSTVAVPLMIGGKVSSSIMLQDTEKEFAFSESTVRLIETLAGSMSTALENVRLFNETERLLVETEERNAELAILNSVQEGLASKLDLQSIYNLVGDKVSEITGSEIVVINTWNSTTGMIRYEYIQEKGERIEVIERPFTPLNKITIPQMEAGKPIIRQEGIIEDLTTASHPPPAGEVPLSVVTIPIKTGNVIRTSISIQDTQQENAFNDATIRLVETLAGSMGIALENAHLFEETTQRNAELAIVNSVSEAMTHNLDVQTVVKNVGDKVQEIFEADMVAIGFIPDGKQVMEIPYSYALGKYFQEDPIPSGQGLAWKLVESRRPLLLTSAAELEAHGSVKTAADGGYEDQIQTWLGVPIIIGEKLIGGVSVQSYQVNAYGERDQHLLSTLAANMGAAIENARLFEETTHLLKETEAQNAELAVINSVQEALAAQLDLQGIYDAVGDKIQEIFDAQALVISTLDHQKKMAQARYFFENGQRLSASTYPFTGLVDHICKTGAKVVINENMAARTEEFKMIRTGEEPKSGVWIPFKTGSEIRGIISLQNLELEHSFSDSDVRLLETLAHSMSIALENARLFNELQSSNKEISEALERQTAISEILHIISNSPGEIQPVLQAVAEHAAELCQADDVQIYRRVADRIIEIGHFGPLPTLNAEESLPLDPGLLTARAMLDLRTIHLDAGELSAEDYPLSSELQKRLKHRSVIITPLVLDEEAIGAIVARRNEVREFSKNEISLLDTFANQAAIAIENVRLFEESRRLLAESVQQADELQTVNTVSTALSSELELDALISLIGDQVQKIFDADIAYLALKNDETGYIDFPYSYGEEVVKLKFGEGLTSKVMQMGEPLLINRNEEWGKTKKRIGVEAQSYLGVPISVSKQVIGVISVQSTKLSNMYGEKEVRLLSTIAANIGAAIDNANLFNEVDRQKEYFEALISSAPVAIITIDLIGNVTGWSPAAQNLFGYTEEEAIGANIDDLISNHPDVRVEAENLTRHYIKEIGKIQLKSQRTHKDGQLIDVAINAMPVLIEGETSGYIAIYNDVSELESARREAEEANFAKSAFLANMSHELRTPLNAIIGFTRIVKRKGEADLPEKQIGNLDKVLVSAEHLLGLINTVLDISKIEAGRMEVHATTFELKSLLNLVLATSQPLLKNGNVSFRSQIPDDLPMVNSDIEKVKQILINLISNAAKFTHKGEILLEARPVGDKIEIDVTDTGIGISPEALDRIFEEFQQADSSTTREYGGTGLGLSISRSLARLLEGDLQAVSRVGEGSTFTFSFPINFGKLDDDPLHLAETSDIQGDGPLILVIDDNEDAIYLMQEMLETSGYRVAVARDGDDGYAMAKELLPFAITLDIMMPKKDGWQVLHDLKANPGTKSIPVILISIVDQKALGYRLGAEDYLVKPLQEDEILKSLQKVRSREGSKPIKRLLVVDDDPTIEDMISQLLEGTKYQVESAFDGMDALEKIEANMPDAILLDLMMPRLDGLGLLDRLKQDPQLADIPVIVLTAKLLNQTETDALKKSVGQVIQKEGISGKQLLKEIRQTISETV